MAMRSTTWRRAAYTILIAFVVASFVVIGMLIKEVRQDLGHLESASSDNVQWTLAQAEVEFLEFSSVLRTSPETTEELTELRRRFDVFYSRISTLSTGPIYRNLTKIEGYSGAIADIKSFLAQHVANIDADDDILRRSLPEFQVGAAELRPRIRAMSTYGLHYFAALSERRRNDVSTTLVRLATATTFLVAILTFFAIYFRSMNRQNVSRRMQLLQTSARMRTIIDTSLDAVIVTDAFGLIIEFNPAAERIFQRDRIDVRGNNIANIIIPENYRDAHHQGMRRMRSEGTPKVVGKGRITLEAIRANGEVFPVELAIQSAHNNDREIYVAYLRDISQRVHDEQELVAARDRALAGEKAKADFLAVMSHEIRTPLNGLIGTLSLLRDTPLTSKQKTYLENMSISGRLLMGHVNNVLDITRYEAGATTTDAEHINVSSLVQDLIDGQLGGAEAAGNALEWGWTGTAHHWVVADALRIQHVLLNLVGNAIKFTNGGRVSVEIEAQTGDTDILEFRVIDTGDGIPQDQIERIFEDFVTQDTSYGRRTNGTGLGLGIAKRIVTALGGKIGAESTEGQGSTFWIQIPVEFADAPTTLDQSAANTVGADQDRLDILVVEDNEINRHVVREMLFAQGHKVTEATDGQEGVQLAQTKRFDLILMDISMPVMDGRNATRTIRAGQGMSRAAPIIALTANVMAEEIERFLEDGMNDVLSKPLMPEELRRVINSTPRSRANTPTVENSAVNVDQNQSMKDSIGPEAYDIFLTRFDDEMREHLQWFTQNIVDADAQEEISARAHKLASSAAVFGAMPLRDTLIAIENEAKSGTARLPHITTMIEVWGDTKAALGIT